MTAAPLVPLADEGGPTIAIYRQLRGLIVSGQLGVNERLPTVRQTASDLGVATGTVAKAYKMLEQDGLVVSRTAAGTRVAPGAAAFPRSVMRHVRALVTEADAAGARPDEVVDVLRAVWRGFSAAAETDADRDGEGAMTSDALTTGLSGEGRRR
ncbi:GntR family transcriptional regulator [Microbacterium sp. Marseille-Q6965]|uniref:GntR family transcriptional regulator n=1 Tax=Microbacterium sp. Marseille-Q6965 TaxID=2965072 RepID=UPI0021B7A565|nr:GntR family transcriptional regulator [Microbacterium sp. Marseille-Q6965]